jgi:hypothetical protein
MDWTVDRWTALLPGHVVARLKQSTLRIHEVSTRGEPFILRYLIRRMYRRSIVL